MTRQYSWPEGHWAWPVKLTHKHGVKAGNMIFTGGQVDLDSTGQVRNPNDLSAQCDGSMAYLRDVLADLGSDWRDVIRLVVYFVGDAEDEQALQQQIGRIIGADAYPVINMISLPELCYENMMIEIEGVAMRAEDGSRLPRQCHRVPGLAPLHEPFSHVVQCEDMIVTGDMTAIDEDGILAAPGNLSEQSRLMMENLGIALAAAGADSGDVVKLNVYYVGDGTAEDWEAPARVRADFFPDPGPAATGMPVSRFPNPDMMSRISVTAMRGQGGARLDKAFAWPEGHWDWTMPLPYKHGNRCGDMIHVGGQVSLDTSAHVVDPDDMVAQTRRAMSNIARVLEEFGATLDDVVKVTTFYQGQASAEALHENLLIRSTSYTEPGPATTGIPMEMLVYENMVIEIEVTAICDRQR